MTVALLPPQTVDERRASPAGRAWIMLVCVGCFLVTSVDFDAARRWRVAGTADVHGWVAQVESGQAVRQVAFLTLAAVGTLGLLTRGRVAHRLKWPVALPAGLLLVWAYASVLWSHDPGLTVKRLVVFTGLWTSAAAVCLHVRPQVVLLSGLGFCLLMLLLGVWGEVREGWTPAERFAGVMHPNHSGLAAATGLVLCAWAAGVAGPGRRRLLLGVVGVVLFLLLIATRSRTALAAGVAGWTCFLALRGKSASVAAALLGGSVAVAVGVLLYETGMLGPVWEAALLGRDESNVRTLTGRTDIWSFGVSQLLTDPARVLTGFGHDSFWNAGKTADVGRLLGFPISEAHSVYLEIVLNLGVVGGILFVAVGVSALLYHLTRRPSTPGSAAAVSLLVLAAVHGLVESTFTHAQFPTFLAAWVVARAAFRDESDA